MGLDMYAFKVKGGTITKPVDFTVGDDESIELCYWRKHPDLHGWIEKVYERKGGKAESFNCVNVQLTKEDLDKLEKVIKKKQLVPTSGFFFGQSNGSEINHDLQFISDAREAIEQGYEVYYTSWW